MWSKVIEELPEYHCIAIDMPGHADSSEIEWTSPEEVAADVAVTIQSLAKGGRAHIVGLSLGGLVGLHLLAQSPETVRKTLVTGVPSFRMPNQWLTQILGVLVSPFIHSKTLLVASARAARIPDSDIPEYVLHAKKNSRRAFLRINRQAVDFQPPDGALVSETDKLFIAGERDHPTIVRSLHHFVHAKNAACYKVRKLGHAWSSQNPELFAEVVLAWLSESPMPDSLMPVSQ